MKRPILKACLLSLVALLALASLTGAWVWRSFFHTRPLSEQELARLTPDWDAMTPPAGTPWRTLPGGRAEWNPVVAHNARIDAMENRDRAWPVVIELRHANPELFDPNAFEHDPEAEGWDATSALLQQGHARACIRRLSDACRRPALGRRLFPRTSVTTGDGPPRIVTHDPDEYDALARLGISGHTLAPIDDQALSLHEADSVSVQRDLHVARLLVAGANLALLEGDPDRYAALIESADAWARMIDEFPRTFDQVSTLVCAGMCRDSIAWALRTDPGLLGDGHLQRLDAVLARAESLHIEWRADAMFLHDRVRRSLDTDELPVLASLAQGAGTPDQPQRSPSSTPDDALPPLTQRLLYSINVMSATPADPPGERTDTPASSRWLRSQSRLMRYSAFRFLLGASITQDHLAAQLEAHNELARRTRDAIAMHRHALRHGSMPTDIASVDPELLASD